MNYAQRTTEVENLFGRSEFCQSRCGNQIVEIGADIAGPMYDGTILRVISLVHCVGNTKFDFCQYKDDVSQCPAWRKSHRI